MGKVIPFSKKEDFNAGCISEDFNQLLQTIIRSASVKKESNKIEIVKNPEEFIQGEISSFLMEKKLIDPELFRCTLYVSKVVSNYFSTIPESYYASDYYLDGIDENNPETIKRGADFCFLLCTFFPERGTHRVMKLGNYFKMGRVMYFSFYEMTRRTIGLSMGNKFADMVKIVKKTIVQ
ncbi:MAG: hypothetical protein RBS77_01675 [Candidatus Moranbacteria bacterium]|jgi:hypothetical protein|nr:hypothetical protein [Candidatus Moranbacteria bacterium]